jgi:hypothetical protein
MKIIARVRAQEVSSLVDGRLTVGERHTMINETIMQELPLSIDRLLIAVMMFSVKK